MKSTWKIFFIVEALLSLVVFYQLLRNFPLLIMLILSTWYFFRRITSRKKHQSQFGIVVSIIFILIAVANTPGIWLMLIFAFVYLGFIFLKGDNQTANSFKKNKLFFVKTKEPQINNGKKFKRTWFGNNSIGKDVYEWDDINLTLLGGDTIIDLGNTFLPKDDSQVTIVKGIGRTRILVPIGIGLKLEHSAFFGSVWFEGEKYTLQNETVKLYSEDYDGNTRRLKIFTNCISGDIEVIRV